MIEIKAFGGDDSNVNEVAKLYRSIWNTADIGIEDRINRHTAYDGFRGVVARKKNGNTVGFAYGYKSLEGQYYNGVLRKALNGDVANRWLGDCFEFVEIAVHPSERGKHLAQQMMQQLFANVQHKTAILTTQVSNTAARALYEKVNWVVIKDSFVPNNDGVPYVIMGKELIDGEYIS